ncbi:LMBR1-like membrane protein-domain-containing protein [Aspergillus ambiguus]|uniref:LMBR1-like membrane protein-domain-containing protein n=1 Tax=Aspergillus ambiguus TaxID=176160 RepID=UPI003CCE160A
MPIPIASSIFFASTLLLISLVVLLLLRRFLTLRATPAYLILPVFLALALPASVVLLVPIDLASSSRDGTGPRAIWLPDRLLLVTWRIAYWLIFVLTWAILPLLGEYVDSGYRDPQRRLQYSIRSNARYQLTVLACAAVGLIYISIQNGFRFGSIKGLVMALAYVWGLVLAIYLMGHGLVSIPRTLFRNASVSGRLRRLQAHAPRLHDRLMDAVNDLESLEAQVAQLQRRKTGSAREFHEWIEDLAEPSAAPDDRAPLLDPPVDAARTVPTVITERYLADLTRRLQRARHQKARFVDEWDRLVLLAADLQAILNASASKKLEFHHAPHRSSWFPRGKLLTPYLRYLLYVHLVPQIRLLLGALCTLASGCVIWSELIKSLAPRLSVVTLSIVSYHKDPAPVNFGRQVTACAWLLYMCGAALVGVNDAKVWGNRALVRRNTYGESACWYAGLVARLTIPIAYNFLTFLPTSVRQSTTFYHLLGRFIDLTPLGQGFDYFFPVFILLPVAATLFNLYGRVKNICGFGLLEEDDDDMENNPAGYGLGGWREGRDLIERELTGLGSLGLSGRGVSPRATSRSDEATGAFTTSRPPRAEAMRPARPVRGPATASTVLDGGEDEEEENFFQSFAHRVRNTFETADKPQWLQGDYFRLPRWMGNDGSENSGLGRWFGGRPTPGGPRASPQSMTPLLSLGSQSSLGETCAFYVDYLTGHLPPSVQKFVLSPSPPTWLAETLRLDTTASTPTPAATTTALTLVLLSAVVFALMSSSWRDFFRRGPAYAHPPLGADQDTDTEPDTVLLRHRRTTYELQFPPYAINERQLNVGQLRRRAAEVTGTADPHRIKLLYKGALLDDDARPCADEGLKQHSEVLCVVSEVTTPSDGASDADASRSAVEAEEPRRRNRTRNKKKKNKNKSKKKNQGREEEDEEDDEDGGDARLAPPSGPSSGGGAGGGTGGMPPPAPNLKRFATAGEQVRALLAYLRRELTPLGEEYIARPPADAKTRDFEHKKLSETILAQVILKADGIEPGTEEERMARRALVKEALSLSGRLDQAAKE